MPCNSAHIYFDELKKSINIPLLNIVEETAKKIPDNHKRVTLFATSSTYQSKIYQEGIKKAGHEFIFKDKWQVKLNTLIQNIKVNKEHLENIRIWNDLIKSAAREGVENIIIACTDLNVIVEKVNLTINIVDSSKCLAAKVVGEYTKKDGGIANE